MTRAIELGLASAAFYGTTDFVSHVAAKRAGVLRTMIYGQGALACVLSMIVIEMGALPYASPTVWSLLIGSDLCILAATASLTSALARGNLAVVAPVTACYGAVTAVLSIVSGERVGGVALAGLAVAAAGGVLSAMPSRSSSTNSTRPSTGASLAAIAALLYGLGFWLQGRYVIPVLGGLLPVWSYYVVGVVCLIGIATVRGADIRRPDRREAWAIFGTALLAVAGYAALTFGQHTGQVAIVTALSSIASVVTVLLARVVLRTPIGMHRWTGVAAVVTGLMLLRLAD
jgi:drug/metabolite transporter (DMT)-like permease